MGVIAMQATPHLLGGVLSHLLVLGRKFPCGHRGLMERFRSGLAVFERTRLRVSSGLACPERDRVETILFG